MNVHFVGFADPRRTKPSREYINAVAVFGEPDFYHVYWDRRAAAEINSDDVVVFTRKIDPAAEPNKFSFDDSSVF